MVICEFRLGINTFIITLAAYILDRNSPSV